MKALLEKTGVGRVVFLFFLSLVLGMSIGFAESDPPLLAILDTGVCPSHITPEKARLGEAFVLERGWDFVAGELNYQDEAGHGTHMSGIAWRHLEQLRAASDKAQSGRAALCMLRTGVERLDPAHLIKAMEKLAHFRESGQEVAVILCAFALEREDTDAEAYRTFRAKLRALLDQGVVIVAATNGRGENLDTLPEEKSYLPGCLEHANLITVAACSDRGFPAPRASSGEKRVFCAAAGRQIPSLWVRGGEKRLSGSSQAAALVAAEAYFLLTRSAEAVEPTKLREELAARGQLHPSLLGRTASGRFFAPLNDDGSDD